MINYKNKPKYFILDVDGVMTDGTFYYSKSGKILKLFGPDDHDALLYIKKYLHVEFITSDRKKGYEISKKRIVSDMKFKLTRVKASERLNWIKSRFDLNRLIFMGDGIFDSLVMKKVFYSIATIDSDEDCRKIASYVTKKSGGKRAVSEACKHIAKKFFNKKINKP